MTIYMLYMASPIIIYFLMAVICQKSINDDPRLKKTYLIIYGIIMALMIGLRNKNLGSGDTGFYYGNWERLSHYSPSEILGVIAKVDLEPGYQLVTWALSRVFSWGQWALITSGIFFAWSVCAFVYKNARNAPMALVVFNCLGLFNFMVQGLRQAVAMCICLWALEQCKKKNLVKFLIIIAIACSFHASAIVFVVVYIIANFKINFKSIAIFSVLAAIGMASLSYALALLNLMMNETYEMGKGSESGGVVAILISATIVLFGLLSQDKKPTHYPMFIYMTIIAASAMVMRNNLIGIAERIAHYFSFAQMIVLASSIHCLKVKTLRILIYAAAALLCLGVAQHKASYSILIPYKFFWEYKSPARTR